MTFGTLSGMMAADRIMGRANPWSALFDPSRKTLGGLWDYVKENKDYPYYLVRDRFAGTEGKSLRSVPRGSGRVLDLNGRAVAVYRDERGQVTKKAAACTHMGCNVEWNGAERTWDCPCHGRASRPAALSSPARPNRRWPIRKSRRYFSGSISLRRLNRASAATACPAFE